MVRPTCLPGNRYNGLSMIATLTPFRSPLLGSYSTMYLGLFIDTDWFLIHKQVNNWLERHKSFTSHPSKSPEQFSSAIKINPLDQGIGLIDIDSIIFIISQNFFYFHHCFIVQEWWKWITYTYGISDICHWIAYW